MSIKEAREVEVPDELNYETNAESTAAIMKAMNDIIFMDRMRRLMPLVARELARMGVDFSQARLDKVEEVIRVEK